jgi:hypothetical protein
VVSAKCIVPWILEFVGWLVAQCILQKPRKLVPTTKSIFTVIWFQDKLFLTKKKINIILIFFNVNISCVINCLVLDTLMPSGEGIYIYTCFYVCPSYELEFKGHHSTFINDMFFFIFRDYAWVMNLNSGVHSTSINNNVFTVFLFVFFHWCRVKPLNSSSKLRYSLWKWKKKKTL